MLLAVVVLLVAGCGATGNGMGKTREPWEYNDLPMTPSLPGDAYLAALQLNYCQEALTRAATANNRVILDQEYNKIVNNLNLVSIPDVELMQLRKSLLTMFNEFSIREEERERVQEKYRRKVERAFISSMSGALGSAGGMSVWSTVTNTAFSLGGAYFEYQQRVEDYKDQLDEGRWELKKDELRQITEMRSDVLDTSWRILKRYALPDKLRLTEKQIEHFVRVAIGVGGLLGRPVFELRDQQQPGHRVEFLGGSAHGGIEVLGHKIHRHQPQDHVPENPRPARLEFAVGHRGEDLLPHVKQRVLSRITNILHYVL